MLPFQKIVFSSLIVWQWLHKSLQSSVAKVKLIYDLMHTWVQLFFGSNLQWQLESFKTFGCLCTLENPFIVVCLPLHLFKEFFNAFFSWIYFCSLLNSFYSSNCVLINDPSNWLKSAKHKGVWVQQKWYVNGVCLKKRSEDVWRCGQGRKPEYRKMQKSAKQRMDAKYTLVFCLLW